MPDKYRIIRSRRRSRVALRFAADGVLEILAPETVSENFLLRLVENETAVIEKLRRRTAQMSPPAASFTEGGMFAFYGKFYPLHLSCRLRLFDGERFIVPRGDAAGIRDALVTLYRELAASGLIKRAHELEKLTGMRAAEYRISSAATRWGSCTAKKLISLSWKLIQCPPELVDYVIIHELAHTVELNHSPAFWNIVAGFYPDWRCARVKLREFNHRLPQF